MKDKKFILIVYLFVMTLIFVISTTNLVIDENYKKVYDISIIFDDVDSNKYKKLKMGIEDSTFDLFVDINFVYLENKKDVEEQKKAILNEVNSGVDGIIILPTDVDKIDKFIDESGINIPIIALDKQLNSSKVSGTVKTDYREVGEKIGKSIYNVESDKEVIAFSEVGELNTELFSGIKQTLETHGKTVKVVFYTPGSFVSKVDEYNKENTVFIALNSDTTDKFINEYLNNRVDTQKLNLYGLGYRNDFLHYLNNGKITSLALCDEYLVGYIGVQNLIYAIKGESFNAYEIIPNYIINKDDVYKYEKVLFPIN